MRSFCSSCSVKVGCSSTGSYSASCSSKSDDCVADAAVGPVGPLAKSPEEEAAEGVDMMAAIYFFSSGLCCRCWVVKTKSVAKLI